MTVLEELLVTKTDTSKINVLDHGYVHLVKHMGDDLDVVNSAKVSYLKEATTFGEKEERLLGFLAREEHTSVFRHSALTFEVYAPLLVARQWWKYVVASAHTEEQLGWNESSRRYVTEEPTFYVPADDEWRSAPESSKQGSGAPVAKELGNYFTGTLMAYIDHGVEMYERAMREGIAAEQARLFLPAYGMYVRWRWTASLGAVMHFLHQRLEHDAQKEIQEYAKAVAALTATRFPKTIEAIL